MKNGLYKVFENGIILEQSIYKNNEYNGPATFKDAQGNVVLKDYYLGNSVGNWMQDYTQTVCVKCMNSCCNFVVL
jgi:hypothetical protein